MEIFTKMHATITRDRLHGFGSDFDYRFATEPEGSQSKISPGTPVGRHLAGGQFFRFPGVPPWETGKFFVSDLGESCHTVQGDDSE